jgi:glyoxalase family protein
VRFYEKIKIKEIDNLFLPVDDFEKAKEYNEKKLGLEIKFDFSDTKPTIWFVVDDINTEYEKMLENNIKFLTAPFAIRTGNAVEFEDPFGNRFGITDYRK